jgi:hypothetical protein
MIDCVFNLVLLMNFYFYVILIIHHIVHYVAIQSLHATIYFIAGPGGSVS